MMRERRRVPAGDVIRRIAAYSMASARLAMGHPKAFRNAELVRHLPAWWNSLDAEAALENVPWLCFQAIELLENWLKSDMRVFEWGSGGSTIFFAERVASVRSIEHDPAWHDVVRERIARRGLDRCDLRLIEPEPPGSTGADPSDPCGNASGDDRFRTSSFARYVEAIADVPDRSLDLVLVDGRARPSCCRAAIPKIRVGGYLLLDNAERSYYTCARKLLDGPGWELTDVWGPLPAVRHFSETCLWKRVQS